MKKLLAILLALMLVMVSAFALAADGDPETPAGDETPTQETNTRETTPATGTSTTYAPGTNYTLAATAQQTIVIPKVYTVTLPEDQIADKTIPADSIRFTQSAKSVANSSTVSDAPDIVSISTATVTESTTTSYNINIVLPSYTGVGVYTYTLTESDNAVAGVTYIGNISLKVTVVQNGEALQIAGIAIRKAANASSTDSSTKIDKFENEYKAGSLTVKKTVDGNMGDRSKSFPITVTFSEPTDKTVAGTITYYDLADTTTAAGTIAPTAWSQGSASVTLNLKHDQTIRFDNIPEGVTYTVIEGEAITHLTSDTLEPENTEAYLVEGEVKDAATIAVATVTPVEIKNTKNITVDTGVTLETTAYMLIMALTIAGFAMMVIRRRKEY